MIALQDPFRVAQGDDAAELAELVNFAGEGLPLHLWTEIAGAGGDPWYLGRERQAAKAREGQIVVADFGDGAVASLTGYAIGAEPAPISADFPPLVRPLQELENEAPNTWYVNVLAVYPEARGEGLGSRLLEIAERLGAEAGLHRMSVIVADNNAGAKRLYERFGYREVARRACVRDGWQTETQAWILLVKSL